MCVGIRWCHCPEMSALMPWQMAPTCFPARTSVCARRQRHLILSVSNPSLRRSRGPHLPLPSSRVPPRSSLLARLSCLHWPGVLGFRAGVCGLEAVVSSQRFRWHLHLQRFQGGRPFERGARREAEGFVHQPRQGVWGPILIEGVGTHDGIRSSVVAVVDFVVLDPPSGSCGLAPVECLRRTKALWQLF